MRKILQFVLVLSIGLLAEWCVGYDGSTQEFQAVLDSTLSPSIDHLRIKTTVAPGGGGVACPADNPCHARNCCAYFCNVGDSCLVISSKPFCVNATGPYDAMTCVEDRCLQCTVASISCAGRQCSALATNTALALCDFSRIRGPIPAPVVG